MAVSTVRAQVFTRALIQHEVDVQRLNGEERKAKISELALRSIKIEDEYVARRLRESKEGSLYTYSTQEGKECYLKRKEAQELAELLFQTEPAAKEEIRKELELPAVFMQAVLDFEAFENPPYKGLSRSQRAELLSRSIAIQEQLEREGLQEPPFLGRTRIERTAELSLL